MTDRYTLRARLGSARHRAYIRQNLDRLLIDLSRASSRLEGNTYPLLETERLIAFGEAASGKTPFETQMLHNHIAAIEFLV